MFFIVKPGVGEDIWENITGFSCSSWYTPSGNKGEGGLVQEIVVMVLGRGCSENLKTSNAVGQEDMSF